jgi:hypothetical protein
MSSLETIAIATSSARVKAATTYGFSGHFGVFWDPTAIDHELRNRRFAGGS